ncbi:hypothetical protein OYC64_004214 [Pagothenia borchgrevinki]|uniref:C-type lectin domain-containing protein n=1 Tax=Pagothenia borchgrevinki TaxID=8213 RepID=A0ABD2FX46_PAGBO
MQWSLFVLILMGQCSFFTCDLYEYHFIPERKTWDEAQRYCRQKYTDLATVSDMRDLKRLTNSSETTVAWIGLRSINESDIKEWHWSLPGEKYYPTECDPECAPEWAPNQPNNRGDNPENCVVITSSETWYDDHCSRTPTKCICYNETGPQKYFVIDEPKNWLQAQSYCRENHTDLVSGFTQIKAIKDQDRSSIMWIGLFREIWSWSDGKNFSFRHWDPDSFKDEATKTCAMTTSNGKWSSDNCRDKKPFYCYDDKVILIKESKTWDEALTYCRENHRVLVSITDRHQQRWVEKRAKMTDTPVWLGMRYTCTLDLWFWVSDRLVCYQNWATDEMADCGMAGVMKRDGKWYKKADYEKLNFICAK